MIQYQDKYFDQDKNQILRAAQAFVEPRLLTQWVEIAKIHYTRAENPMGLMDDFALHIESIKEFDTDFLKEFYELLSVIYRFTIGDNQLEFIWDGRSHYEVYAENWSDKFVEWTHELSQHPEIYRGILKACILQQDINYKFHFYGIRKIILRKFGVHFSRNKIISYATG
ncbi:MAG: hypothetical protein KI791_04485 [Cyclobacteriaceae bacterium]|nr:hypothetical protein [Cyclobacteriaceae bacterium SS2]